MRRKCFSVSNQAEATQRCTISASRQRVTLCVRRSTPPCGLSMMLVVARHCQCHLGSRAKVVEVPWYANFPHGMISSDYRRRAKELGFAGGAFRLALGSVRARVALWRV